MGEALRLAEDLKDHGAQGDLVLPDLYVGASFAASEIAEKKGDREEAYGLLLTAGATLSDLMGKELAEATVAPRVREPAKHWGDKAFRAVRDRVRQARAAGSPHGAA